MYICVYVSMYVCIYVVFVCVCVCVPIKVQPLLKVVIGCKLLRLFCHGSRFYMIILGVSIKCLQSSKSHLPKIVGTEFFWKIKGPSGC